MGLTNRQDKILEAIVKEYISTGLPVGSKHLSQTLGLGVSPATIRSEMSVLYENGVLEQPHKSAGRVPSYLGIRRYIDYIMKPKKITKLEKNKIDSLFNIKNPDPDKLLKDAANALSDYTGYAAITSSLVSSDVTIQRLEFINAGTNTVVIVLVASDGIVRNKVCRLDFVVTDEIINFFKKFANDRFAGREIESINKSYATSVGLLLGEYSRLFTSLILAVYELCQEICKGKYYVSGSTKLLSYNAEFGRLAQDLLAMIESTDSLKSLFGLRDEKEQILVGGENSVVELTDASVLITQYNVNGKPAGTVGVIGPMRLDYSAIIPHLEYFSDMLGKLLDETLNPDIESGL